MDSGSGAVAEWSPPLSPPPWVATPSAADIAATEAARAPLPDQIARGHSAPIVDRPPTPIVYQPISSSYVGEMAPPLPEPKAKNTPARWALVFIVLAVGGGVAVVGWLAGFDQAVAGVVSLVSLGLAAAAFFLAVGGIVVAVQRPTKRLTPVIALVSSTLLVIWLAIVATGQALAILA
ncbi:hypothetical protein [Microbacterium sp. E-13]|uniref:hypothetical protein n=1 Tax=Microbacterium sp. E-13 TaxID=3404048 RepID=UPI003CF0EF84